MNICDSIPYIETEKLRACGEATAKLMPPDREFPASVCAAKFKKDYETVSKTHDMLSARFGSGNELPAAFEWLLDNMYIVQREYRTALNEFRRKLRLRGSSDGIMLSQLCRVLIHAGRGEISLERCREFLVGFESVTVLRRNELLLFPAVLRAELIAALAELCGELQFSDGRENFAALFEAIFGSLRMLAAADISELLTEADMTDRILRRDPTGEYSRMDEATRSEYLSRVEKLSEKAGVESYKYAERLIDMAKSENRHVGFFLFKPKVRGTGLYILSFTVLTLAASLFPAFKTRSFAAALLLLLPVSELVKALIDLVLLRIVKPQRVPRLDFSEGVDIRGRTVCVISALLSSAEDGGRYAAELEKLYFACRSEGEALCFGLLADLPAADSEHTEIDGAILTAAEAEIKKLNRRYGSRFYLFTRPRRFDGECFTGHERKRGAIIALAHLIAGQESEIEVCGERDALTGIKFILTLDSDTEVKPGSVGELIAAALHPLNRAELDRENGVLRHGHAIFHPRMCTKLESAHATDFSIVFSGSGGCDPYNAVSGELYMDCFSSGGFAGKGLIDIEALLCCADRRIPEGRVLSHDALEGAFLLGAYVSDVEFADSFPGDALSFYKRQHRWIRGDWQNAPWLFSRGRDMSAIDRFRLFDSMRRSLLPPFTMLALLFGMLFPGRGLVTAAMAALVCLLRDLILAAIEGSRRTPEKPRLRRASRLLSGFGGAIVRCFLSLWLLPYEAFVSAAAICTALWRMTVTKKKLLQWQTAAQSAAGQRDFASHIRAFLPEIAVGLLLMLFSPLVIGKAAGFMWLLSPAAAYALALPAYRESQLSGSERDYILKAAADTWRYFCEFSTSDDHYLPPDNFQEQPPKGTAHRTSPTNIGLAMVSAVAACDMGIIEKHSAVSYVNNIMCTLEKMPLCMGHLLNWYDTRTLKPLAPAYISTVDSGNLCAALICTAQAMEEYGEAELALRLRRFSEAMSFSALYDRARGLFYICYDAENNCGAGGWYDLMASEARLTSYLAVARGDIPKKHWGRLSRAQLRCDAYRGLASWTGTMFEYLMPELFLPLYRGSLLFESSRFCLYAQKRRVFAGKPWGISESAYFALDGAMNYRYKANGAGALALKRGQDEDMVISPYSSFLAMAVAPQSAVRNLRRIERCGARGKYGFYEALDFTPGRCRSENGEIVRSYMAHHAGMSIISAANALCGGSIVRRFMRNGAMHAYELLLQERIPDSGVVIRRDESSVPERAERLSAGKWSKSGDCGDGSAVILSNGIYSLRVFSDGMLCAVYGDIEVYSGHCFMPCPLSYSFYEDRAEFRGNVHGTEYLERIFVAGDGSGEVHEIVLTPTADGSLEIKTEFTPLLARHEDYSAHPPYWELGIVRDYQRGIVSMRRLAKSGGNDIFCFLSATDRFEPSFTDERTVKFSIPLLLAGGKTRTVRLTLAAAFENRMPALSPMLRGNMLGAAASLLGMRDGELDTALELLPMLLENRVTGGAAGRELWSYGISGDLPIAACESGAKEAEAMIKAHFLLKSCGLNFDTVLLSAEEGEYHSPFRKSVSSLLSRFGLEALLGSRGGIHILPLSAEEIISSRAAVFAGRKRQALASPSLPVLGSRHSFRQLPEFCHVGNEFRFSLRSLPPKHWSHILTNGDYSCVITESGDGYMFWKNAREMQLTPFEGSELLYAERDGKAVSLFAANDSTDCRVRYAPGCAVWEKELFSRHVKTTVFIAPDSDARVIMIEGAEGLPLHWRLPLKVGGKTDCVSTNIRDGFLYAENSESFFAGVEFIAGCSGKAEMRSDFYPPMLHASLTAENITILVCGVCDILSLTDLCKYNVALEAFRHTVQRWSIKTDVFRLKSGFAALDSFMHPWAVYQTLVSRLYARAGLYQAGGAYGFRDQLQDAENLLLVEPALLRERIIDCCRHQYVEGDVMHWWHPHNEGDKGLRSRCSDDLLWLVRALCVYVEATGERELCYRTVKYISSPLLHSGEKDRFEVAEASYSAFILDHARSALEHALSNGFGEHGLPRMGSGDWNDGFDAIGGESVWLGWFMLDCLERFGRLLDRLELPHGDRYFRIAAELREACESAWCGRWYARAYYPDGDVLGGEERIDSLPQSWAAFCGADSERVNTALTAALGKLVDKKAGIVKLFTPPFSSDERRPGYITAYGEGFRENGGQYTHAAIWLAQALFTVGRTDEGWELLKMLLPESHDIRRYLAEPFVLAADVYAAPGREGEGGWTWYTGSAGWYFRAVTETMLGLRRINGRLEVDPKLPNELPAYCADIVFDGESCRIRADADGTTIEHL